MWERARQQHQKSEQAKEKLPRNDLFGHLEMLEGKTGLKTLFKSCCVRSLEHVCSGQLS